jgi:hypothetical protein
MGRAEEGRRGCTVGGQQWVTLRKSGPSVGDSRERVPWLAKGAHLQTMNIRHEAVPVRCALITPSSRVPTQLNFQRQHDLSSNLVHI